MMQYSKSGIGLTRSFEGCKLVAYQDARGVWTIAYGHTRGVHAGMVCTIDDAVGWLYDDLAEAVRQVNQDVTVPLTQGEFDALVDFCFNCGGFSLEHSTLLRLLNAGDYQGAAGEFHKWDHCDGKEMAGLLRRRLAERDEFNGAPA